VQLGDDLDAGGPDAAGADVVPRVLDLPLQLPPPPEVRELSFDGKRRARRDGVHDDAHADDHQGDREGAPRRALREARQRLAMARRREGDHRHVEASVADAAAGRREGEPAA
jgi:hypothetical protein